MFEKYLDLKNKKKTELLGGGGVITLEELTHLIKFYNEEELKHLIKFYNEGNWNI